MSTAHAPSFHALEICVAPGGYRRADCFIYNRAEHLLRILTSALFGGGGSEGLQGYAGRILIDEPLYLRIWTVQRGQLVAGLDLYPHIQVELRAGEWLPLAELDEENSSRVRDLRVDAAAIIAALPALEEPLLRPGERVTLARQRQARPDLATGFNYVLQTLRRSATTLAYGFNSFEADSRPPVCEPDPPAGEDLLGRARQGDDGERARVFGRALDLNDLDLAEQILATLTHPRELLRAQLEARRGDHGRALWRVARLAHDRGGALEAVAPSPEGFIAGLLQRCVDEPGVGATVISAFKAEGPAAQRERRLALLHRGGRCEQYSRLPLDLAERLPWIQRIELWGGVAVRYHCDGALVAQIAGRLAALPAEPTASREDPGALARATALAWSLVAVAGERRGERSSALLAWGHAGTLVPEAVLPRLGLARLESRASEPALVDAWRKLPVIGHPVDLALLSWCEGDDFDPVALGPVDASSAGFAREVRGTTVPGKGGDVGIGSPIHHGKFGPGVVTRVITESDPKLVIAFEDGSVRTLLARFVSPTR